MSKDLEKLRHLIETSNHDELRKALSQHVLDPNSKEEPVTSRWNTQAVSENSALHYAVFMADFYSIQLLLEYRANVDAQGDLGKTALHMAIKSGLMHIVRKLLEHNARVDIANDSGDTALHIAASLRQKGTIIALIERGADRYAPNKEGKIPIDLFPDFDWGHLSVIASCALNAPAPALEGLLLHEGKATPILIELCGAKRLHELFTLAKWERHLDLAPKLRERIFAALPKHLQTSEMLPDLSELLRGAQQSDAPEWLSNYLEKKHRAKEEPEIII